jgi:recombination protein RecA
MEREEFVKAINKKHGKNSLVRLSEKPQEPYGVNVIPTGSIALDQAIGVGGIPRGRIVQVVGNPSSGKSTLALTLIANAQKMGINTLYIDAEYAVDVFYADAIGVDIEEMFISQPENGEQAMNIVEEAIRSGVIGLVVVDSVAALTPKREMDGEMGDSHMGLLARLMSQVCRKLTGILRVSNTTLLFINQFRDTMSTGGFGGPTRVPTGGKALPFYSSVIIELARIKTNKGIGEDSGEAISNRTQAKITKNKVAPPYRVAEFDIVYGRGIDSVTDTIEVAEKYGLLVKNGKWYQYGDMKFNGKAQFVEYLNENKEVLDGIRRKITESIAAGHTVLVGVSEPESNDTE